MTNESLMRAKISFNISLKKNDMPKLSKVYLDLIINALPLMPIEKFQK